MHYPTLAEKYFLDEFVISCRRLGHRSGFPKVRNKVEMDDQLEELIHCGPKGEVLNTFLCTEKVNLEAAGPTVRPFGNFRKFSLQLEGNEEANSHLASEPLSTSSSHTSWQQAHYRAAAAQGRGPGHQKEAFPTAHLRPDPLQLLSVFQIF